MNKLGKLYDSVANLEYTLYAMPYQELKALVVGHLSMREEDVIRFDSDSEFYRPNYSGKFALEKKETVRPLHAQLGLEQMPFILSFDSKTGAYRLMDGFNRLFGSFGVFSQTVLVKVYEDITKKDWVNIMMHANAWKVSGKGSVSMMDRGFKLSLFEHYGVDLTDSPIGDQAESPLKFEKAFGTYFNGDSFSTMLNNEMFIEDAQAIIKFLSLPLSYHHKTKKVDEWIESDASEMKRYHHSFEQLKQELVYVLGAIRRKEIREGLPQSEVTIDVLEEFYKQDNLQKHLVKVTQMQVPGFKKNYIEKYLTETMKEYLMVKMGHDYMPPASKSTRTQATMAVTKDML